MRCAPGRRAWIFISLCWPTRRSPEKFRVKQIEYAFDLQRQLKNVDKIFARVFEKPGKSGGRSIGHTKPARDRRRH